MDDASPFKRILDIIYVLLGITTILGQFFYSSHIRQYLGFGSNDNSFVFLIIFTVMISLAITVTIYVHRYQIMMLRFHFRRDLYQKFLVQQYEINIKPEEFPKNPILEPFYIDITKVSFILLLISIVLCSSMLVTSIVVAKSILYMLFILTSVSITVISLIHLSESISYQRTTDKQFDKVYACIKDFLAPHFRTIRRQDNFPQAGNTRIIIESEGKFYSITANRSNPNLYFLVEEIEKPNT